MEQKEGKFRGWSAEGRKVEVRKEIKQRFLKMEKKINKTKSWYINTDKPLAKIMKNKRKRTQTIITKINKIKN